MAATLSPTGTVTITVNTRAGNVDVTADDKATAQGLARNVDGFTGVALYTWTTPVRMFGRCAGCKTRFVVQGVTLAQAPGDPSPRPTDTGRALLDAVQDQQCTASGWGHVITWQGIKGTVNGQTCSAKCHESASPVCKCSCGGAEHGSLA